ncbi:hypothetical protein [Amycolatopsis sp. FDAARGOS 1241]|uniref:hypothetical protein n=1 Tax=Amycolatopsis sp. FDAARGOS 1241 TaxID=2778070 RepID=UPI0019518416|nr:hypothetical protein [Amycolatopsis sp. FDAARGOS 1241]QRP42676.1 hypothetical protein I6J71_24580 [Amycolatopsis sp. FDAARGOS 1241]
MTRLPATFVKLTAQDLIGGVFANHDFGGQPAGRDYIVQTTGIRRDGDASIIAVDLTPNPMTDDTELHTAPPYSAGISCSPGPRGPSSTRTLSGHYGCWASSVAQIAFPR